MSRNNFVWTFLNLLLISQLSVCCAVGQEFRIETHVYQQDETQPVSHSVTLFTPKLVCDFLLSAGSDPQPVEVVLFDTRLNSMVLLDYSRQRQVEIPDLQLLKLVDGLRREAQENERTQFLVNDEFEESNDWAGGWLTLTSPHVEYRVKGAQPSDVSVLPLYFKFLEHFTRLNASDPTKFPPFPRMRLNRAIKKLGWIPDEVHISVDAKEWFQQPLQATSRHILTHALSEQDRLMISEAKKQWMSLKQVEFAEYRSLPTRKIKDFLKTDGT